MFGGVVWWHCFVLEVVELEMCLVRFESQIGSLEGGGDGILELCLRYVDAFIPLLLQDKVRKLIDNASSIESWSAGE